MNNNELMEKLGRYITSEICSNKDFPRKEMIKKLAKDFNAEEMMALGFKFDEIMEVSPEDGHAWLDLFGLINDTMTKMYHQNKITKCDEHLAKKAVKEMNYLLNDKGNTCDFFNGELYMFLLKEGKIIPKSYDEYQLDWIKDHGFTLKDLINCLDEYQKIDKHNLKESFDNWCAEEGFNGEIFVSEEEYYSNDFFEGNIVEDELKGKELVFEGIDYHFKISCDALYILTVYEPTETPKSKKYAKLSEALSEMFTLANDFHVKLETIQLVESIEYPCNLDTFIKEFNSQEKCHRYALENYAPEIFWKESGGIIIRESEADEGVGCFNDFITIQMVDMFGYEDYKEHIYKFAVFTYTEGCGESYIALHDTIQQAVEDYKKRCKCISAE